MKGSMDKLLIPAKKEKVGRKVWVIRHGQTKLNKEDRIRGWNDIPLDEVGIQEAKDLGEAMFKDNIELDGIISSDLLRALQTSMEVSKETGIPILGETRILRPWNVGEWTGMDGKKAHAMMSDLARYAPDEPAGKDGESFNIFKHRFLVGLIGILNTNRGLNLGIVSHSRGERILHGWAAAGYSANLGIDLDEFLAPGEKTATAMELIVDCPLVLP